MDNIVDTPIDSHLESFYKPSLLIRIKSTLIDSAVVILLMFVAAFILNSLQVESGTVRGLAMGLIILYEPLFVALGNTIGQKAMGLGVVKSSSLKQSGASENINIFSSILRYLAKIFLGWISLLTIHSDKYGQAIHDKVGNSIMTYK